MLEVLKKVELALPELLKSADGWKSMFVDYEYPHVERIWLPWEGHRISLHRIHEIPKGAEPLWHPHPWPQAVRLMAGSYEMGLGSGKESANVVARIIVEPRNCYEMIDPDGWHYVKPLEDCYSLMVTGKPWDRPLHKNTKPMRELNDLEFKMLFRYFVNNYPKPFNVFDHID